MIMEKYNSISFSSNWPKNLNHLFFLFLCFNIFSITPATALCPTKDYKKTMVSQKEKPSEQNELQRYFKNWQISGALGVSQLNTNHGRYLFNPGGKLPHPESDTFITDRATRQLNTKNGIGYNLPIKAMQKNKILNNILLELNFYNFSGSAYGEVSRFGAPPQFVDFTLNVESNSRLMLDIKPILFTRHGFSPYIILGTGIGWIKTTYHSYNHNMPVNQERTTASSTNKKLVLEGGGGLSYAFNNHVGVSLEYLFTRFGKISVDNATYTDNSAPPPTTYSVNSPTFTNMYTNSVLLGFYVKI